MRVRFQRMWFAPVVTGPVNDQRVISGVRYKAGVHEDVPEELRKHLPKDAEVLKNLPVEDEVEEPKTATLADVDDMRVAADQEAAMIAEADDRRAEQLKEKRRAAMARAREAKKAKAEAKKKGE